MYRLALTAVLFTLVCSQTGWGSPAFSSPDLIADSASLLTRLEAPKANYSSELEQFQLFRSDLQRSLKSATPLQAGALLQAYFNIVRAVVRGSLLSQDSKAWNLNQIRDSVTISVPTSIAAQIPAVLEAPRDAVMTSATSTEITYSIQPSLVLSIGLRLLARSTTNYETLVRCLAGAAYSTKYADAFLSSNAGSLSVMAGRLQSFSSKPFCMGTDFSSYAQEYSKFQMVDMRDTLARAEFLNAMPSLDALVSPDLRANSKKTFLWNDDVEQVDSSWISLVLAPEVLGEAPASKDDPSPLTLDELKSLSRPLANADASILGGSEKFLTVFDTQLMSDLRDATKAQVGYIPLTDQEFERRARLGQIFYLRMAIAKSIRRFHIAAGFAPANMALTSAEVESFMNSAFASALRPTLAAILAATLPQYEYPNVGPLKISDAINAALARHQQAIHNSPNYTVWLNGLVSTILSASTPETALSLQVKGLTKGMRKAAQDMLAKTGSQVADRDLPYVPAMVLQMLSGEARQHGGRVQSWFELVQSAGGYKDSALAANQVEIFIQKSLPSAAVCEPSPVSLTDRAWIGTSSFLASMFGSSSGPTHLNSAANDCLQFVRLMTFADLRQTGDQPKTMAPVVDAIDKYWSESNRHTLLNFYRQLLKLDSLNQYRVLDLHLSDAPQTLAEVLAETDGSQDVERGAARVMQNLFAVMNELLQAQSLNDLAPLIARSTFLDAAFSGMNALLHDGSGDGRDMATLFGLSELIKANQFKSFTDLKNVSTDDSNDIFLALNRYHAMKKDQFKMQLGQHTSVWNTVSSDALSIVYPVIGLMTVRSLSSRAPAFWMGARMGELYNTTRSIELGYFSFLTAVFAAEPVYQQFYNFHQLDKLTKYDEQHANTEIMANGPAILSAGEQIDQRADIDALRSDGEFRRDMGIVLTVVPALAAPAFRLGERVFADRAKSFWRKKDTQWRTWKRLSDTPDNKLTPAQLLLKPEAIRSLDKDIVELHDMATSRLSRVAMYNSTELRGLGISSQELGALAHQPENARGILNIDRLKAAREKIETEHPITGVDDATRDANMQIRAQANNNYRRVIKALFERVAVYSEIPDYARAIYSQAYGGKATFIGDVAKEFEKAVLGL